jgi:hypothetical protein
MLPTSGKDFVDKNKTISVFRGSQDIYLYQKPMIISPNTGLTAVIDARVGGLLGLGGSRSVTHVLFNQQQYYPGEKCVVKLICDNSNCSSAVKSFKIKLKRKVFARGERIQMYVDKDTQVLKTSKYLYQFKDNTVKCGARQKVEHTLSFDIPREDPDIITDASVVFSTPQKHLIRTLTGSVNGDLY